LIGANHPVILVGTKHQETSETRKKAQAEIFVSQMSGVAELNSLFYEGSIHCKSV